MSLFKKKEFFTPEQRDRIVGAIRNAEMQTSGEIRLYVESHCRFVDPLDRAGELFSGLKMQETKERNGVLIYVATKDRQLAVLGDEGIHKKVGTAFWHQEVNKMLQHFRDQDYTEGIILIIEDIGRALSSNFPYIRDTDKNELPDDLVFGK
ncbi:MAG TPA: TPM domain-containing protein [Flavitalea sp.]|nr:TPM domain-containing protein [Flavitalea sp.]